MVKGIRLIRNAFKQSTSIWSTLISTPRYQEIITYTFYCKTIAIVDKKLKNIVLFEVKKYFFMIIVYLYFQNKHSKKSFGVRNPRDPARARDCFAKHTLGVVVYIEYPPFRHENCLLCNFLD